MRVLYFGCYDREGGRNAIVQAALRAAGVELVECQVALWRDTGAKLGAARGRGAALAAAGRQAAAWLRLIARHRRQAAYDLMLVGSTAHLDLPLARRLADRRGVPLVFDPLVSIGETLRDRGLARPDTLRARLLEALERRLFALPDRVLVDTPEHGLAWARELGLAPEATILVPAGAPAVYRSHTPPYQATAPDPQRPLRVVYAGQFIPLHGLETVLDAAARLAERRDIVFELVGEGQTHAAIRARAERMGLPNLRFLPTWMPAERLAREHLAGAGLCLGIFGDQAKARRVLPFKVYAALAAGRPVLSADTPALRALLRPGEEVWTVPAADPAALAAAIAQLADDPATRARLAAAGQAAWDARFAPEILGRRLLADLSALLAAFDPARPDRASVDACDAARHSGPRHAWRTDRLAAALLEASARPASPGPLLDAGCGPGSVALKLAAAGPAVLAFDRDPRRVGLTRDRARRAGLADGLHVFVADALALPLADGGLAGATAGELLEHVADDAAALRELRRVLAPGGRLALTVPAGPARLDAFDRAVGHHRRYDRASLRAGIEAADLSLLRLEPWGWPFGRLYDRWMQRPALRAPRGTRRRRAMGWLGRSRPVHRAWRWLFGLDEGLAGLAGERGSGWRALAERPPDGSRRNPPSGRSRSSST